MTEPGETRVRIVGSCNEASDIFDRLVHGQVPFCFDTETWGTKLEKAPIIGLAIAAREDRWYFPLGHYEPMRTKIEPDIQAAYERDVALWQDQRALPIAERRFRKKPVSPPRRSYDEQVHGLLPWSGNLPGNELFPLLFHFLSDHKSLKGAHNLSFDWRALNTAFRRYDLVEPDDVFWPEGLADSLVCAYALSLHLRTYKGRLGLDWLAKRYLKREKDWAVLDSFFESRGLRGVHIRKGHLWCAPVDAVARYCAIDADLCRLLLKKFWSHIPSDPGALRMYRREMALTRVMVGMESRPKRVDLTYVRDRVERGRKVLAGMEARIKEIAGEEFNPGSPIQLARVLRKRKIHLPLTADCEEKILKAEANDEDTSTIKRSYSTANEILVPLKEKDPLVAAILERRALDKRINTDLAGVLAWSTPDENEPRYGNIWPNYNQFAARTGRLSSSDPNGQNRTRDDDENAKEWSVRRAFIVSPPRKKVRRYILSADWRQIEPRWTAHLSKDPNMLRVYLEHRDLYVEMGKYVLRVGIKFNDKEWKAHYPKWRQAMKTLVLAMEYGSGPRTTAATLRREAEVDCTEEQAAEWIARLKDRFSRVWEYSDFLAGQYRQQGHIRNPFGRILYLDDDRRTYALLNAMVQSSAADLLKQATLDVDMALRKERLDCWASETVHDELVFDVAGPDVKKAIPIIRREMTKLELRVPLEVDFAITATSLSDQIEFDPEKGIPWERLRG